MTPPSLRRRTLFWNLDADLLTDLTARGELQTVLDLIGEFAIFVDPAVARAVRVVYPATARITFERGRQGKVVKGIRYWTNQPAESAVLEALGSNELHFAGIVVCHVYPGSPSDPRHFTRLANLFVIPATLSAFTEWGPVLAALEWRAFELYGYRGPTGKIPERPALLPKSWAFPAPLTGERRAEIVKRLRHLRAARPMYSNPRRGDHVAAAAAAADAGWPWGRLDAELLRLAPAQRTLAHDARNLDAEFWRAIKADRRIKVVVGWVVRHSYFAPPATVAACHNPFPKTRRARWWRGQRAGNVKGGIAYSGNQPALTALIVAVGAVIRKTRGGIVDHLWPEACYLPAHNAHLGGLVLTSRALSTVVDAPLVRAILQRHAFERTGYKGPHGRVPPRPPHMPASWPETVHLTPAQEARAIATLRRYRRERPQYYRRWKPGGPGRPPRRSN